MNLLEDYFLDLEDYVLIFLFSYVPNSIPYYNMGKLKPFFLTIILVFFGIGMYRYIDTSIQFRGKIVSYTIEGKTYRVYVADTQEKRQKGLMNIKNLKNTDGMIFLFPDAQYRTFWNKNTHLDLNIFWINENTITGTSFLSSIEKSKDIVTVSSPKQVNKVLEIISSKPLFPAESLSQ